ncbi:MAG: hypothetical protein M1838_005514 [Thelocarpon superellum]|nr:MAG: hypothetical protein M1838_005514 [Thelocarpon superellum]
MGHQKAIKFDPPPLLKAGRRLSLDASLSPKSSTDSLILSDISTDSEALSTPRTASTDGLHPLHSIDSTPTDLGSSRKRRASTALITHNDESIKQLLGDGDSGTALLQKVCCGGGCCLMNAPWTDVLPSSTNPVIPPDNDAYRSLHINLGPLTRQSNLTGTIEVPPDSVSFATVSSNDAPQTSTVEQHPPPFVQPHPPYDVYAARLHHARELTKPGAEKRTYHFDLDVTDYPKEGGDVDFVVGGAIGVCAPNSAEAVDEVFDLLGVPRFLRDKPVLLKTVGGRWPTIWGEEQSRELPTTRRELLTWCTDLQSYPPTKHLLSLFAAYATAEDEKKILTYLVSAQGQGAFCDLRTGNHITIAQLLLAFPSARPPLPHLLSNLQQLMPRFYSLSNDPHTSCQRDGENCRRLIEIAVTVHEGTDWRGGIRRGVGSGFLERCAKQVMEAEAAGRPVGDPDICIPMFRGLMANPLAKEFVSDGPLLLIGAGVGIAPFRGFVQRRLRNASCANKVWVLQGVRDALLDELYSGEWGTNEADVKKVVQSRRAGGRYVQEEVRHQADLVWSIINAVDGRVFVCGSSKGMGEGVEEALVDVAVRKGELNHDEAVEYWKGKKEAGQYISETW